MERTLLEVTGHILHRTDDPDGMSIRDMRDVYDSDAPPENDEAPARLPGNRSSGSSGTASPIGSTSSALSRASDVLLLEIGIDRPQLDPVEFRFNYTWAGQEARHA